MSQKKIRIGLIFGGRSGEHEVSLASAASVMENINPDKYEVVPIAINKAGSWQMGITPKQALAAAQESTPQIASEQTQTTAVTLTGDPTLGRLIPIDSREQLADNGQIDVILPVLHGTYGEDGALQGLLEMANVPYVGCGVLGSALGMDKEKMKMVFQTVGLPIVDSITYRRNVWEREPEQVLKTIEDRIGYPCFVKPVNLGSSVGISKATNREELAEAMRVAAEYDRKIIIEHGVNCRELETAVLGNDEPLVSVVGEIVTGGAFYDYDSKYVTGTSKTFIPAEISPETSNEIRRQALLAFEALDLSGLARVDFFLDKDNGQVYINEVNTLPGFTNISMYSKLWAASGVSYPELIDRLIELAIERHGDRQRNRTSR